MGSHNRPPLALVLSGSGWKGKMEVIFHKFAGDDWVVKTLEWSPNENPVEVLIRNYRANMYDGLSAIVVPSTIRKIKGQLIDTADGGTQDSLEAVVDFIAMLASDTFVTIIDNGEDRPYGDGPSEELNDLAEMLKQASFRDIQLDGVDSPYNDTPIEHFYRVLDTKTLSEDALVDHFYYAETGHPTLDIRRLFGSDEVEDTIDFVDSHTAESNGFTRVNRNGQTVAVVSSKGGVSKTNTTINLATGIARLTKMAASMRDDLEPARVLIIDLDLSVMGSQLRSRTGKVHPRGYGIWNVYQASSDLESMRDALEESVVHSDEMGVDLLLGAETQSVANRIDAAFLTNLIAAARLNYDYIVIDTGGNVNDDRYREGILKNADKVLYMASTKPTEIDLAHGWFQEYVKGSPLSPPVLDESHVRLIWNEHIPGAKFNTNLYKDKLGEHTILTTLPNLDHRFMDSLENAYRTHTLIDPPPALADPVFKEAYKRMQDGLFTICRSVITTDIPEGFY